jgi:hypothetical protein
LGLAAYVLHSPKTLDVCRDAHRIAVHVDADHSPQAVHSRGPLLQGIEDESEIEDWLYFYRRLEDHVHARSADIRSHPHLPTQFDRNCHFASGCNPSFGHAVSLLTCSVLAGRAVRHITEVKVLYT